MSKKRIFITGGTGFFGKSLFRHCRSLDDFDIILLVPESEKRSIAADPLFLNRSVQFIFGDVRDFEFPLADFDYILHAATTSCKIISDEEMRSVVIDGTKHVLQFAGKNKNLTNFLYVSSGAVYGKNFTTPMQEHFPCKPVTVYGKAKLEAERLCRLSGIPYSIARCFAFVGEYLPLNAHFAIGNFIDNCLRNQPIVIKGDGSPIRTYLYAADLANWLMKILHHGKTEEIYNVGSDFEVSIAELAETVRRVAGSENEIKILSPPSNRPPHRYTPDISRIKKELGLRIEYSLEEAIYKTMLYHGLSKRPASAEIQYSNHWTSYERIDKV